ncbi:rhomboid family intramembrane serine protease [Streptomyces sp. TLI_171]|uniref:rhomboid family intramembrane serine protease n=1 Tax=Streptomyces sp. TLI_171 TaxID=1938859 RepID=UPI000C196E36|nr:rhomboid family intramembrane serine protease [Streptomyces sp. TLI_171]RKE18704.1 membrane associated rhomboid family serine protease [Streptomyces sp. TLI_171]
MVLSAPARAGSPAAERAARAPVVSYLLIALSALVLLAGPSGLNPLYGSGDARVCAEQRYQHRWGAVPAELLSGRPLTAAQLSSLPPAAPGCVLPPTPGKVPELSVLTSLFVHAGWLHLVGNLLFLFVFGPAVEARLGRVRFLVGYLAIGYLATYGYAVAEAHTADGTRALVGASGAIAGVLGAYLRLYPKARVTTLVPVLLFLPLRFPAWLVLGLWFALQWWSVSSGGTGVAYLVHVIGFVTGWLFAWAARPAGDTLGGPSRTGVVQ